MNNFALPDHVEQLAADTAALARDDLRPLADAHEPGRVNRALLSRLGEAGLLERALGIDDSGVQADISVLDLCVLRESLAYHCTEAETAFALQGLGGHPLVAAGSSDVVVRWAMPAARGEIAMAFALSEPEGGSDVAALQLAAEADGDGFRLNGTKTWISNAPDADVYTVFARTSDDGSRGISAFAVPAYADGLSGTSIRMIAPHPIGRLEFDDVYVPRNQLLGEVGQGFSIAMATLNIFRPSVGGFSLGMAQAALDAAVEWSAERHAFGGPLRDKQAVSHLLAQMATQLEAARLLVYRAASVADEHEADPKLSAMAKLFATETAQSVVDAAVQVHGAVALQEDHLLAHLYREVRAPRIYEGASEIQREIIARFMHTPPTTEVRT